MDLNKKNPPLANVYVVLCKYGVKYKKIDGVSVAEPDLKQLLETKTLVKQMQAGILKSLFQEIRVEVSMSSILWQMIRRSAFHR